MTENMIQFNEETGEYDLPAEADNNLRLYQKQLVVLLKVLLIWLDKPQK
jgi:hypothetical protein